MLESWLGTISRAEFFREFYLHKPYSVALGAPQAASLLSWDIFWQVLPRSRHPTSWQFGTGVSGGDSIREPTAKPLTYSRRGTASSRDTPSGVIPA